MKREILTGDELDVVTGGARSVKIPTSMSQKFSSPARLVDIKSELNSADFVPMNQGSSRKSLKEFKKARNVG